MLPQSIQSHRTTPLAAPRALSRLKARSTEDGGFSLIELLVVMLIIGVLAAIAIPSFLNSTTKATDAQAKELVRTAETTAEVIATDDNGKYSNVSMEELKRVEPTILTTAGAGQAFLSKATSGEDEYTLTATSTNGDRLTISREASGKITRTCVSPTLKTGCGGKRTSNW